MCTLSGWLLNHGIAIAVHHLNGKPLDSPAKLTHDWYATDSWPIYHRQLTDIPPKVDRHITDSWPIYYRHTTDIRSRCVDEISTDTRPMVQHSVDRMSVDTRPTVDHLSIDSRSMVDRQAVDCRSTVDRLSIDCRSTIDRYSDRVSTAIAVDIAVDITYSKHDPLDQTLALYAHINKRWYLIIVCLLTPHLS